MQDVAAEALTASEKLIDTSAAASIPFKEVKQDIHHLEKQVHSFSFHFCVFSSNEIQMYFAYKVKDMRKELNKITDDDKNKK